MIKIENVEVWGFKHAIRGMRNPLNSWDRSDSIVCNLMYGGTKCIRRECDCDGIKTIDCVVGKNDLDLMRRLFKAGPEHRKYARQIFVSMDITAPLYWWKEFDTYKVGTTSDSCSTMHKIAEKEFTLDDFSHEHLLDCTLDVVIERLNLYRKLYIQQSNKDTYDEGFVDAETCWWQMIQLLPSSYNQRRTVTFTYENVFSMIKQRSGHKLDEWRKFVEILKELSYVEEIMSDENM